jgi:sensor domain CHASE-containing protein
MQRVRSPRQKAILIFLVATLCIVFVISGLAYYLILGSFASLEDEQSRADITIILNTFNEQGQSLANTAKMYGVNDETYQFLGIEGYPPYANTTLNSSKFKEQQLNFLIIYNRTGDMVFSKAYDLASSQEISLSDTMTGAFSNIETYASLSQLNSSYGIVRVGDIVIRVAISPIIPRDQSGLSRGTLVVGRYIDAEYIDKLSTITNRPIDIGVIGASGMASDLKEAENYFTGSSAAGIYVHPLGTNEIASYALLTDINKNPGFILRTERSRDIFTKGVAAVGYFIISLAIITTIFIFFGRRIINNAFIQIDKNIEQFAILGDHIRNPLTVIVGLADLYETDISRRIIDQAKIINEIVNQLDTGWIESEKIKGFLRKYSKK